MSVLAVLLTASVAWAQPQGQTVNAERIRLGVTGTTALIQSGSGSPEGAVTAVVGTQYLNITNGVWYRKATGSGNTGWVAATITGTATHVAYFTATDVIGGSANLTYDAGTFTVSGSDGAFQTTGLTQALGRANDTAANGPALFLARARNTLASPAAVELDDLFGGIYWLGHDGTNYLIGASIKGEADDDADTDNLATRLVIATTPFGGSSPIERVRVSSAGTVLFTGSVNNTFFFGDEGDAVFNYYADDSAPVLVYFNKARGDITTPTIVQAGDEIGQFEFRGHDGNDPVPAAGFGGYVDGPPGAADMPGGMYFKTTPLGSDTLADALRLDSTQRANFYGDLRHPSYTSQATNWQVTAAGAADYRYLFADEMRIKLFSAEEQAVYRASLMVTRSHSEVSQAFTCPAAAGTATLWVRDAATLADARVFTNSNWVVIRNFTRADADADGAQELVVGDCVGQVTSYTDGSGANAGQQSWTFTRGSGGSAGTITAATVIPVGNAVIDFGVAGAGAVELSAYDGTEGVQSPWIQTKRWATSPVAANFSVTSRLGNLSGLSDYTTTSCTSSLPCFGLFAGDSAATNITVDPTNGVRFRNSTTTLGQLTSSAWTLGSTSTEHVNIISTAVQLKDGSTVLTEMVGGAVIVGASATENVNITSTSVQLRDGSTVYTDLTGGVATFGRVAAGQGNVYMSGGAVEVRNNTTVRIRLANDGSGYLANSNVSWDTAGNMSIASATIGGWSIGSNYVRDAATVVGMSSAVTGGDDIRFWAGDATPASAEFRVTEAGALTATSATITGTITSTAGLIGGWEIGADYLRSAADDVGISSAVTGGDDIRFWAGDSTMASAEFKVTEAGVLTASSGTVGGWTLGATSLTGTNVGLSTAVTGGLDYRFWSGDSTASSAEFSVDENGLLRSISAVFGSGSTSVEVDSSGLVVNGGRIEAGGGDVLIDDDGITLQAGAGVTNQVKWSGGSALYESTGTLTLSAAGSLALDAGVDLYLSGLPASTGSGYPLVSDATDGTTAMYYKNDGLNGASACAGGQFIDSITAARGIVMSKTCSTPFSAEITALQQEIQELRRLVHALLADRKGQR